MASVNIKSTVNSRTHTGLPHGWNVHDLYYAERIDNTHWKVHDNSRSSYIVWPVEDVEVIVEDTDWPPSPEALTRQEKSVPVELVSSGVVGPSRISSKGTNHQQIAKPKPKIASDGGATGYYDLPAGCNTLYDLIEHKNMNFSEGNVFKAIYRMGDKEGIDTLYDWNKIKFCAEREIARIKRKKNG